MTRTEYDKWLKNYMKLHYDDNGRIKQTVFDNKDMKDRLAVCYANYEAVEEPDFYSKQLIISYIVDLRIQELRSVTSNFIEEMDDEESDKDAYQAAKDLIHNCKVIEEEMDIFRKHYLQREKKHKSSVV